MSARGVSAVVLAGGRSSRFGRDKLAEPIDGRPLLSYAVEAVRPFATEVLVVVAPGSAPGPAFPDGVTLVHDPVAFEGPLAGLLAGLEAAREPTILVVGGDMPTLVGAILAAMLAELRVPEAPDVSEAPEVPEAPEAPDTAATTDRPGLPEAPDTAAATDRPGLPDAVHAAGTDRPGGPDALYAVGMHVASDGAHAVVLEQDGRARPLPMVLRRAPALAAAAHLIKAGERRLRTLTETLPTRIIPESTWRAIDPGGLTLHDIDAPSDLA